MVQVIDFTTKKSTASDAVDWLSQVPPQIMVYVHSCPDVTFQILYDKKTGEFNGIVRRDRINVIQ